MFPRNSKNSEGNVLLSLKRVLQVKPLFIHSQRSGLSMQATITEYRDFYKQKER